MTEKEKIEERQKAVLKRAKEATEEADQKRKDAQKASKEARDEAKLAAREARKALGLVGASQQQLAIVQSAIAERESVARRLAVDWGGGSTAQVLTFLINLGISSIKADPAGFFGRNRDLFMSVPHFMIGLALYGVELAYREGLPSGKAEFVSEASKIFAQLGVANFGTAMLLRFRRAKAAMAALQASQKAA